MTALYLLDQNVLILLVLLLTAAASFQTMTLMLDRRPLGRKHVNLPALLQEVLVLVQILLLTDMTAEVCYHSTTGFVYPGSGQILRGLLFAAFVVLSGIRICGGTGAGCLWMIPPAALTLPQTELYAGSWFPLIFLLAVGWWLVRAVRRYVRLKRQQKTSLSAVSVKEAIDSLNTGILFCRKNGRVVLQNEQMQRVISAMKGALISNGKTFYESLVSGDAGPGCTRLAIGDELGYRLPDGRCWWFSLEFVRKRKSEYAILLATDITDLWQTTQQLRSQRAALAQRNTEIRKMLQNLDSICEAEAAIYAKSRIHDLLGQRISLLLRSIRERKEPDQELLNAFAEGLPRELFEETRNGGYTLEPLAEVFRNLGVSIRITGRMPRSETLSHAVYNITTEAVTNAVRHGFASEVDVFLEDTSDRICLSIRNRGVLPEEPITEGGGLKEMRRQAEQLGGSFQYHVDREFCIKAEFPKEGTEK